MFPPDEVAGPSTSTAELIGPIPYIAPDHFEDIEKEWRLQRTGQFRDSCMRIQLRVVEKLEKTHPGRKNGERTRKVDTDLIKMTQELMVLQSCTAAQRAVASTEAQDIFETIGFIKPPEEKPPRIKIGRRGRLELQPSIQHDADQQQTQSGAVQASTANTSKSAEKTHKDRLDLMKVTRPQVQSNPSTPQPAPTPQPAENGNDSPTPPPVAINKGKRRAAATTAAVAVSANSVAEKPDKRPRRDANVKKRTSNRLSKTPRVNTKEDDEPTYCFCNRVSFGEMIGCDNEKCEIEWFHFECIGLTTKPKGKWFCPNCRHPDSARMPKTAAPPALPVKTVQLTAFSMKKDIKEVKEQQPLVQAQPQATA